MKRSHWLMSLFLLAGLILGGCSNDAGGSVRIDEIDAAATGGATIPKPPKITGQKPASEGASTATSPGSSPRSSAVTPVVSRPTPRTITGRYRLKIPQIEIDAPVVEVGLESDNSLAAPPDPWVLGIYKPGPQPGQKGNVLVTAHLDWLDDGTGVASAALCWRCREIAVGSQIIIQDGGKTYTYKVTKSLKLRYDAPEAQKVMWPSNDAILTLITCEGPGFDEKTRNYTFRRIIIASLQ